MRDVRVGDQKKAMTVIAGTGDMAAAAAASTEGASPVLAGGAVPGGKGGAVARKTRVYARRVPRWAANAMCRSNNSVI